MKKKFLGIVLLPLLEVLESYLSQRSGIMDYFVTELCGLWLSVQQFQDLGVLLMWFIRAEEFLQVVNGQ